MERIKILFLTFVLFLSSVGGMACWDDWDDDWDDWDDWGDDWCHYNDDDGSYWLNNVDVTPDDIGGDDDGSIWLDEVFVTYNVDDDDNGNDNNDDWGDYDFGLNEGDDDYDSNDNCNDHTSIAGNSESDKEPKYKLQKTDRLCTARWRLNSLNGFKQGTANTCVPAGMEFVAKLFNINGVTESTVALSLVQGMGFDALNGEYSTEKLVDTLINTANSNGLQAKIVDDIKEAINDGAVVMTTKPTEDGNHDIIIVGYNDKGYIAYDTDKSAGYYVNIPESEVNSLYNISIKK